MIRTASGYFRAHNATIIGDVSIGELSSFWFNSVVRADVAPIRIGRRVNVQDGAIIHCDNGIPNEIADDVTIGHGAIVHGAFVGEGSLIGMSATLLGQTRVGRGCLVAAGAVLTPGTQVPDGMLVMGVPARIVRPVNDQEIAYLRWLSGHYVELARRYIAGQFAQHG
ncbi:gamma carbonic anhydrase family protein [Fontivita pretiosa]|uniref:gamma carbonic anhydrase family protein n=1 Tax=Fontivita pretiosa TaxID=2989684 RepID=UPI003D162BBF